MASILTSEQLPSSVDVVFDSGTSGHYVREEDKSYVLNVEPHIGPSLTLSDSTNN